MSPIANLHSQFTPEPWIVLLKLPMKLFSHGLPGSTQRASPDAAVYVRCGEPAGYLIGMLKIAGRTPVQGRSQHRTIP